MISGIAYTIIGVKNRWLQIFLSAAYLASLAVTVLVLYVMNPPVSNAIQGAYLVAIVMTGLILGGAATIFQEMTEGLGCLLGGFAISMWLLVLKPGGLLTSTSSKAVFIVAFTVAAFSTSFSHYTRPYGLLISIPFAGATALVLGIDCFSQAGLKEFWAYLWDLNSNLFPLGATSYPITRGMKVEIAAIIVIFLGGLVSQMKLWKVIKDRRDKRALTRLQDERTMEQGGDNVSRGVDGTAAGDRDQWDNAYGSKPGKSSDRDSGVGDMESQKKGPRSTVTSVRRSDDEIEMTDMPSPTVKSGAGLIMGNNGQNGGPVTVRVARDVEPTPEQIEAASSMEQDSNRQSHVSARDSMQEPKIWVVGADGEARLERPTQRNSKRISGTTAPDVVPLPFTVPEHDHEDDRSSVATFADDDELARKRRSKHLSVGSLLMRKLSGRSAKSHRDSKNFTSGEGVSTDDLVIPRTIEDDRRSSIAATIDGLSDDEDMRSIRSSMHFAPDTNESARPASSLSIPVVQLEGEAVEGHVQEENVKEVFPEGGNTTRPVSDIIVATEILDSESTSEEKGKEIEAPVQQSLTSSTDPKTSNEASPAQEAYEAVEEAKVGPSVVSVVDSKPASITKDRLPAQLSKVVMSYRTNEWAKHLSAAEEPELDELKVATDPIQENEITEAVAPVNVEELQQTAENGAPPPSRAGSHTSTIGLPRSNSAMSKVYPAGPSRPDSSMYQAQENTLQRNASQLSVNTLSAPRGFRSSSVPHIPQQIVESPHEEENPSNSAYQPASKFASPENPFGSTTTLMDKRDTMLRNKPSYSVTPSALASTAEHTPFSSSSDAGSIYNLPQDDDNMSLSARREMIRQSSNPLQSTPQLYDSHQPKRQSSTANPVAREQQLASWRASVQQDLQSNVQPRHTIERSRSALWQERQQEEQKRVEEMRRKGQRDSRFDERMRRGDMLDAHRDALRRMQASANKHA